MSSHKPHGPKQQASPKKELCEAEKGCCHCQIDPKFAVQIDIVQDLRDEIKAAKKESSAQNRTQLFWTKVATFLIFLYTGLTGWQLKVARDTYTAANRPYVGIEEITTAFAGDANQQLITPHTAKKMRVSVVIKNFGPVPGTNFTARWKMFLNGKQIVPEQPIPDRPSTIFPTQPIFLVGDLGSEDYPRIANGEEVLTLETTIQYSGPSGSYQECNKEQYKPGINSFLNLGPLCSSN